MASNEHIELGVLISTEKGYKYHPLVDVMQKTAESSIKKNLEMLASTMADNGLKIIKKDLSVLTDGSMGTFFYDGFRFHLEDSKIYVSLDGENIVYLKNLDVKNSEENLQETMDGAMFNISGDLIKLLEVKIPSLKELSFLPHPLDISSQNYQKICFFTKQFPKYFEEVPLNISLERLGFRELKEGNNTINLFGEDSIRLYKQGDVRHINHLRRCLKDKINSGQSLDEIKEKFTSNTYEFRIEHSYDKFN